MRNGYRTQKALIARELTSRASGHPRISAKQTWMLGMAAKGLNSALTGALSAGMPVKRATESVKPHSGKNRGGAVGKTT
jgi:hypothetical protein